MKKAVLFVEEFEGREIGSIERMGEASIIDAWNIHILNNGNAIRVEVPVELEEVPTSQLEGVLIPYLGEYWEKDGVTVSVDPEDPTFTYYPEVLEHWVIEKKDTFIAYEKGERISVKFNTLNAEVITEMKTTYDTTNPDSASANVLHWLIMKMEPAKFESAGLWVRIATTSYALGTALDTEQKVLEYATEALDMAISYSISREQKILQFIVDRQTIQAE